MNKSFRFDFEDESELSSITFDYNLDDSELLRFGSDGDGVFLAANKAGFLCLSKLFAKLA